MNPYFFHGIDWFSELQICLFCLLWFFKLKSDLSNELPWKFCQQKIEFVDSGLGVGCSDNQVSDM